MRCAVKAIRAILSARLAHENGVLDILASDYHPGAMLTAVMTLAQSDPDGLPGAMALVTRNPAKALGLTDRGAIKPGLLADLVFVQTGKMPRVTATMRAGRFVHSLGDVALLDQPKLQPA